MGFHGEMKDRLNEIAAMRPLSEREKNLAYMVVFNADDWDASEVLDDEAFWGKDAADLVRELSSDD